MGKKPGKKSKSSRAQSGPRRSKEYNSDGVVAGLELAGLPVTRENYLKHIGDVLPEGPDAELEATIPPELQAGGSLDV